MNNLDKWKQIYEFGKDGFFNYAALYDRICEQYKDGTFVEIGVWQGMSLSYLMLHAQHSDIWGVDTFQGDPLNPAEQNLIKKHNFNLEELTRAKMKQLNLEPDLLVMESVEASKRFENEQCSFVYIDGGHSYQQVKADLEAWYPKVKFGGTIAGHDYPAGGVQRAVQEFFGKNSFQVEGDYWWIER